MDTRTVLITGCSSGIGYATAHGLKGRGYRVFATARRGADVARLRSEGLESVELDLTDAVSIASGLGQVLELTGGTLYGLFNNGAYGQPGAVEDLRTEVLRRQFECNFFGWHELTRRVIPIMRGQGCGRIIQNSSLLGFAAMKYRGAYNASKFAIEGLSDTLRLELNGTNIFVSLIEPGPITSRFRESAYAAFRRDIDTESSPHRDAYHAVEKRLASKGPAPFTEPPIAILKRVIHALESPRPKPRYYVTAPTYAFAYLKRLLPHSAMDWVLLGASRGEHRS